jgi:mono/diheme cytochrome c family protein
MTYSFKKLQTRRAMVLGLVFSGALGASSPMAGEASHSGADTPTVEQDFHFHCAACHGADGKGSGPVSRVLKIAPPDLTRIAARNGGVFPEAVVFETISGLNMPTFHGTPEMPVWVNEFVGETLTGSVSVEEAQEAVSEATDRIKRLVEFIGSIQAAK